MQGNFNLKINGFVPATCFSIGLWDYQTKNIDMPIKKNNQEYFQQRYGVIHNHAMEVTRNSDINVSIYFSWFRHMGKNNNVDHSKLQLINIFGLVKDFRSYILLYNFWCEVYYCHAVVKQWWEMGD